MSDEKLKVSATNKVMDHVVIKFENPILGSAFLKAAKETCEKLGNQLYKQPAGGEMFHIGQVSGDVDRHLRFSPDKEGSPLNPEERYPRIVLSIHQWPVTNGSHGGAPARALARFHLELGKHLIATEHER